jgi:hypothetical protein
MLARLWEPSRVESGVCAQQNLCTMFAKLYDMVGHHDPNSIFENRLPIQKG